ncbi:MAG: hypothetical protein C7B45_14090 [Sulfobacillus acidophilus]|uniref:Enoyl-CoA hydratase/isomerase family protein n=1 Tax=Sulfobacillus acidophilus TaxID=53633 RepID=A0A2T2WEG9_9FIRM|nr:MAG: hypothetical protein C7B45_14090 [Sulfobacillus acidophilus]
MRAEVTLSREKQVACVWIDQPLRRNALRLNMWQQLGEVLQAVDADPTVRVVVTRGSDGTVSAGAAISEFVRAKI